MTRWDPEPGRCWGTGPPVSKVEGSGEALLGLDPGVVKSRRQCPSLSGQGTCYLPLPPPPVEDSRTHSKGGRVTRTYTRLHTSELVS